MSLKANVKDLTSWLIKMNLYDFIKEMWDTIDTAEFSDSWLIEFQSECFMYSVKHYLPQFITKDWLNDEEYEKIKKENNAYCPVRDVKYQGGPTRNHDWNIAPRHMKSYIMNVFGPVWLGINAPLTVASVSHTLNLSSEMNMKRQTMLESDKYFYYFGDNTKLLLKTSTASRIELFNGSKFYSVCQANFTGFGADIIINDDLVSADNARKDMQVLKNAIDFFGKTMPSRLNNPLTTGVIWQIQQRISPGDISGYIANDHGLKSLYSHTELKAIADRDETFIFPCSGKIKHIKKGDYLWPERFGDYEKVKMQLGENEFETQYNQNPTASSLSIVKPEHIQYISDNEYNEFRETAEFVYGSHDCPVKEKDTSDYHGYVSALGKTNELIIDGAWMKHMGYIKEREFMQNLYQVQPNITQIIEDKANGSAHIQALKGEIGGVVPFEPGSKSKTQRVEQASLFIKNGAVRFVKNPETEKLIDNLLRFPMLLHDDDVDACTQLIIYHFTLRKVGLYTNAFTYKNIISPRELNPGEVVYYEYPVTYQNGNIQVLEVERSLTEDKFIVNKEFVFSDLERFEQFYNENSVNGNMFLDASINNLLKSIIPNIYMTQYDFDRDKEGSISTLKLGFYKKNVLVTTKCTNLIKDIANIKLTQSASNDGTIKLDGGNEGFVRCIRALITYHKGSSGNWY